MILGRERLCASLATWQLARQSWLHRASTSSYPTAASTKAITDPCSLPSRNASVPTIKGRRADRELDAGAALGRTRVRHRTFVRRAIAPSRVGLGRSTRVRVKDVWLRSHANERPPVRG